MSAAIFTPGFGGSPETPLATTASARREPFSISAASLFPAPWLELPNVPWDDDAASLEDPEACRGASRGAVSDPFPVCVVVGDPIAGKG